MGSRVTHWQSACLRTKRSAVQASATAPCCGGELFTYIQLLLLLRPVKRERNSQQKQQTNNNDQDYVQHNAIGRPFSQFFIFSLRMTTDTPSYYSINLYIYYVFTLKYNTLQIGLRLRFMQEDVEIYHQCSQLYQN